ncbi:hypothetical protein EJ04DRAFT_517577 [Polyplosphaeria fusca]|uniref:Uncharacterized protein n=1 Tax=Polyplosphaeria fusca TaxID=682080 RepID=A0A9P4QI63_9PLEO|nr:hypothetical protein EJ04DRAFT_517577 [Polyplosphaeria fusca]
MSLINRTFLFVILLISCTVLAISQKCYDSNGVETGNTPCNASALVSHCCGPTFVCLDNGLCKPGPNSSDAGYQTFTAFYHAGCTDPTFKSEECSKFCMSGMSEMYRVTRY